MAGCRLVSTGIKTVAMESTGVYWIPVFEVLQDQGIQVIVANAREVRSVPGRKSDVNDAQWLHYRRLATRIGKAKAVTATARKIAVLFYNTMRFGTQYKDPGADHYERQYRDRVIKQLHRRAAEFGYILHEATPTSVS